MISRKAVVAVLSIAALVLGTSAIAALAAGPYDTPPVIHGKGKSKLKKGKVKVATVTCGTGTCSVTRAKAKVVAPGGVKVKGKFTKSSRAPFGPGQTIVLKVKIPKSVQGLSKEKVKWNVAASSSVGLSASKGGKTKVK